ncbi:MAG: nucleotide exchange factor GrpE [Candidatus Diapherotrites archaeon]|nr:nucleotide exchange factor GrpE [Candidatus Diapherotrites archaeon]
MAKEKSKKTCKKELMEKIKALENELSHEKALAEERLTQIKYLRADFDNYVKKLDAEKQEYAKIANEKLILDLLPLLDDFESAIKTGVCDLHGLSLLYSKLLKVCEAHGLKKIDALNKKFDPNLHEVIQKEVCDKDDGLIISEFQSGYMLNSKVIRPSKVKIAVKS